MRAVVVSHGEVDPGDAAHVRGADLIIAADGGTLHLEGWGIRPHLVVGDLDSLGEAAVERLGQGGVSVERWPAAKDQSDTELALDRAFAAGADEVVVVGALGGPRDDHAIANVLLLARRREGRARLHLARGPLRIGLLRGGERAELAGAEGETVSLLAVGGDARDVRTTGLRYPLAGETLALGSSRGLSNEISVRPASVGLGSGALLVVEGGALPGRQPPQPKA